MLERVIGVFKLDVNTFEEIEADQNATMQAATVVLIVALVGALGSGIAALITDTGFISSFISSLIATFIGWLIWSAVTYFVGTTFFEGKADIGEMLRVVGFAYAPQILGIIPCIGWLIGLVWTLAAGFIAVRQGLDLDNTKAALTIGIGFIAYLIIFFVIGLIFGTGAAAMSAITG